jgi:hypothetical protein
MSRVVRVVSLSCAMLLAAGVLPAQACAVQRPEPTKAQAAAVEPPRSGFVGKVAWTYTADKNGRAIVQVNVDESFGEKLPPVVYVVNPGCCVCVGIGGKRGQDVVSIVSRGDDGLYHLNY